jgi:hypothetical protein
MPLESGTYISSLVATNPVGASDPKSQGDDHLRLIKSTLLNTFPALTGAVTATQAELNILDGVTASAAQLNILATDGAGAGILADLAAVADPGADRVFGWDESGNAAIGFSLSTGLVFSTTNILIDTTVVPRLAEANPFTKNSGSLNQAALQINSATPTFQFSDTDGGTDQQHWFLGGTSAASSSTLDIFTRTDAGSFGEYALRIFRSAGAITEVEIDGDEFEVNAATIDFNGALDVSGLVTIGAGSHAEYVVTPSLGIAVAGAANFVLRDSTNNVEGLFRADNGGSVILGATTVHSLILRTSNTDRVTIAADGSELQIDVTTLDLSGDVSMTGTRAIDATTRLNLTGATVSVGESGGILGFFAGAGTTKGTITGDLSSPGQAEAVLSSLLIRLAQHGLIVNSTTPP